jgi:hypothetical protein
MSSAARILSTPAGSWLRTSSRRWVTSSLSVAPGSISDERTYRAVTSWRKAAAGSDASARDRADVDEVSDPARLELGGAQEVRERCVGDVEQPLEVELDHPIPLLDGGVDDRAEQHHAASIGWLDTARLAACAAADLGIARAGRGVAAEPA